MHENVEKCGKSMEIFEKSLKKCEKSVLKSGKCVDMFEKSLEKCAKSIQCTMYNVGLAGRYFWTAASLDLKQGFSSCKQAVQNGEKLETSVCADISF